MEREIEPYINSADAIETMARHLLEEEYRNYTWPTLRDDDGYRGNGYVAIAPPDIQEELREKAARILIRASQIAAASAKETRNEQ